MSVSTGESGEIIAELRLLLAGWNKECDALSAESQEVLSGDELAFCIEDLSKLIERHST